MNKLTLRILFVISAASAQSAGLFDPLANCRRACDSVKASLQFAPEIPSSLHIDPKESATDSFYKLEGLKPVDSKSPSKVHNLYNLLIDRHRTTMQKYYDYIQALERVHNTACDIIELNNQDKKIGYPSDCAGSGDSTSEEGCDIIQLDEVGHPFSLQTVPEKQRQLREERRQLKEAKAQALHNIQVTRAIVEFICQNSKHEGLHNIAKTLNKVIEALGLSKTCEVEFSFIHSDMDRLLQGDYVHTVIATAKARQNSKDHEEARKVAQSVQRELETLHAALEKKLKALSDEDVYTI